MKHTNTAHPLTSRTAELELTVKKCLYNCEWWHCNAQGLHVRRYQLQASGLQHAQLLMCQMMLVFIYNYTECTTAPFSSGTRSLRHAFSMLIFERQKTNRIYFSLDQHGIIAVCTDGFISIIETLPGVRPTDAHNAVILKNNSASKPLLHRITAPMKVILANTHHVFFNNRRTLF